jgi:hypothetical protein
LAVLDAAEPDGPLPPSEAGVGGAMVDGQISPDQALGGAGAGGSTSGGAGGGGGQGGGDAATTGVDGPIQLADAPEAVSEAGVGEAGAVDQGGLVLDAGATDTGGDDVPMGADAAATDAPAALAAHAGPDRTICSGSAVQVGALPTGGTPGYSYAWSANPTCTGCIDDATVAQPMVSPTATTTFTVAVTDSVSAEASDTVTVTVVAGTAPVADAGPDVSTDPAAAVQIGTAAVAGNTYAWTCDRTDCALSSASAARPVVRPTLSTQYTVTVTSPAGCMRSDSVIVWVNLPLASTPADGETAYANNAHLLVHFGAPILAASLTSSTVSLVEASSGTAVTFSSSYDSASRTLDIVPTGANYDATIADYTLILTGGAAGIVSDDPLRPQVLPSDQLIDFTIVGAADSTAPTILFRSPAQGTTGVARNGAVVIGFSETLDPATVTASDVYLSTAAGNIAATLAHDSASNTVTLTPSVTLAASTMHTVHVVGVADPAGNAMSATTWSFTTGSTSDATPPTVTSVTPGNAASGVSVATNVVVTFSEMIDQTTLAAGFGLSHGGVPVAGSIAYNASIRQATFTPSTFLNGATSNIVTMSGVRDLAGNAMAATFTSTFTTGAVLFADSFENGTAQWTLDSPWALTPKAFKSAGHSLTDSPDGNYDAGLDISATSIAFDASTVPSVTVRFWLRGSTQNNQDRLYLEYSRNAGAWTQLANYSGNMGWAQRSQALTLPTGTTNLQIRFRLTSNASQQYDGVYIDDVTVQSP